MIYPKQATQLLSRHGTPISRSQLLPSLFHLRHNPITRTKLTDNYSGQRNPVSSPQWETPASPTGRQTATGSDEPLRDRVLRERRQWTTWQQYQTTLETQARCTAFDAARDAAAIFPPRPAFLTPVYGTAPSHESSLPARNGNANAGNDIGDFTRATSGRSASPFTHSPRLQPSSPQAASPSQGTSPTASIPVTEPSFMDQINAMFSEVNNPQTNPNTRASTLLGIQAAFQTMDAGYDGISAELVRLDNLSDRLADENNHFGAMNHALRGQIAELEERNRELEKDTSMQRDLIRGFIGVARRERAEMQRLRGELDQTLRAGERLAAVAEGYLTGVDADEDEDADADEDMVEETDETGSPQPECEEMVVLTRTEVDALGALMRLSLEDRRQGSQGTDTGSDREAQTPEDKREEGDQVEEGDVEEDRSDDEAEVPDTFQYEESRESSPQIPYPTVVA